MIFYIHPTSFILQNNSMGKIFFHSRNLSIFFEVTQTLVELKSRPVFYPYSIVSHDLMCYFVFPLTKGRYPLYFCPLPCLVCEVCLHVLGLYANCSKISILSPNVSKFSTFLPSLLPLDLFPTFLPFFPLSLPSISFLFCFKHFLSIYCMLK